MVLYNIAMYSLIDLNAYLIAISLNALALYIVLYNMKFLCHLN